MTRWRWRSEVGQAAGPEMMLVLVLALASWGVLAWLGRLNSTSQDIQNTAQAAARAASIEDDPGNGKDAAERIVANSNLPTPCAGVPEITGYSVEPGANDGWRGGSVTVTLTCTIANREGYAGAGRTVTATDTQVIEPYREDG